MTDVAREVIEREIAALDERRAKLAAALDMLSPERELRLMEQDQTPETFDKADPTADNGDHPRPRKRFRNGSPHQSRPWDQPGNASYWLRQASMKNVEKIREVLRVAGSDGITQKEIAELAEVNSATVSRAIVALWKYGELEFLGRAQSGAGKGHRTSNIWRLWTGDGPPPNPEARWAIVRKAGA